jgi:hypothetical protein
MRDDQKARLEDIKLTAIDNAIAEFDEACGLSLQNKEERGDRRWLTMMASSSIKLYRDISAVLDGHKAPNGEEEDEDKRLQKIIEDAAGKVAKFEQRQG